jgi:hypothetical protein
MDGIITKNSEKSIFKLRRTKKATKVFRYKFPKKGLVKLAWISLNTE